jgi:hypothetical protein
LGVGEKKQFTLPQNFVHVQKKYASGYTNFFFISFAFNNNKKLFTLMTLNFMKKKNDWCGPAKRNLKKAYEKNL